MGAEEGTARVTASQAFRWRLAAVVLVIIAAVAIASTARTFSATVDEPAHIAAGMQWLSTGEFTYDTQHPPLGRIVVAALPYVKGVRSTGAPTIFEEGARILGAADRHAATLADARHGVLVFFVILGIGVWIWGRELLGDAGAAAAVLLLVTNPNILAHSGLATTDAACAATTVLALYAGVRWLEKATMARSVTLGLMLAIAVGSRLSALAFVGGPLAALYVLRGWSERRWQVGGSSVRESAANLGAAIGVTLAGLLTLYRFDPGPLLAGVQTFFLHGGSGHPTFLLGTPSNTGWWYYFPVALLVKTPIPLLLLSLVGSAAVLQSLRAERVWKRAAPLVCAVVILLISLIVRVNLGVRLVLPIYPLMAIIGAQGALVLLHQTSRVPGRAIVAALLAAASMIAIRAHPDHLAYFNAFAGDHPEHVLVDSNLDWGQDLYRLRDTLAARGVTDSVRIAYFGTTSPTAAGVPRARFLGLHERATGWIAASETFLAGEWVGGAYSWLLAYPAVARIGPGMRLWYFPPATRDSLLR